MKQSLQRVKIEVDFPSMPRISVIHAYEIIASGGTPSVEARVHLDDGAVGISSVPFGASAGLHEAAVLFDGDEKRFRGKGMLKAVANVNREIAQALHGMDVADLQAIDRRMIELDGTDQKTRLGGNAILVVSLACANAVAVSEKRELHELLQERFSLPGSPQRLPYPMMVLLEGGRHADHSTDFQEYLVVPDGAPTAQEAVRWGIEIMMALKDLLKMGGFSTNVGNEGAFAPEGIISNEQPLQFLMQAIEKAGFKPGEQVKLAIDPATSEVYDNGVYRLPKDGHMLKTKEMADLMLSWAEKYPMLSIEDGLAEDDWDAWTDLTKRLTEKGVLSIGDDLTATNPKRIQRAIDAGSITGLLVKLNQIGTLSETIDAMKLANAHNITTIVSHRGGGETNSTFMVDVAVAAGAKYVKVGPTRGERVGKYNRLIAIEDRLATPTL